eukprot:scaffold23749_cov126-Isochrysis_galbana.AAC.1
MCGSSSGAAGDGDRPAGETGVRGTAARPPALCMASKLVSVCGCTECPTPPAAVEDTHTTGVLSVPAPLRGGKSYMLAFEGDRGVQLPMLGRGGGRPNPARSSGEGCPAAAAVGSAPNGDGGPLVAGVHPPPSPESE